ncbi:MAG: class I SAM-dependent methyltransferase [Alphaproteobacteria bacterium]|nr:class I SAM-dependent methyltransferase [Alphaproteobacteria bacterium]
MIAEDLAASSPYTNHYFSSLSPALLRFVPLLHRMHAGPYGARFTYVELGCGQALSLLVIAAANPGATFYGVDYSPAHVARARRMAELAGLANVHFIEKRFEDMVEADLPPADIVALHGVWSWIGPETRSAVVRIIERHLKPGGIAHLSYNTMTTWTQLVPIQRLMNDHAERGVGTAEERATQAMAFVEKLLGTNLGYFKDQKAMQKWLEHIRSGDIRYVLHEYFVRHWQPTQHSEVVEMLQPAKLTFVGSCDVIDTIDRFLLPPDAVKFLADVPQGPLKETVRDLLRSNGFRRDVFVRGPVPMTPAEWRALARVQRFAPLRRRDRCPLSLPFPVGKVDLNPGTFDPILDRLADGPATVAEIGALVGEAQDGVVLRRLVTLAAAGYAYPCAAAGDVDPGPAARFNRTIVREIAAGHAHDILASPTLGAGVRIPSSRIAGHADGTLPPAAPGTEAEAELLAERRLVQALDVRFAPG